MNQDKIKEIAIKYGVATLEKSAEFDFLGNTIWVWYQNDVTEWCLIRRSRLRNMRMSNVTVIPAPQMHEIAVLLPEKIIIEEYADLDKTKTIKHECYLSLLAYESVGYWLEYQSLDAQQSWYPYQVKNNHYAEAYAQMYLNLKQEGLLKQS